VGDTEGGSTELATIGGSVRFSVQYRHGAAESLDEVPDETIRQLLDELDDDPEDIEHGDVWITEAASGWTLGAFVGDRQLVVLEDTNPGGVAFHQLGISRQGAFELMRRMADGGVDAIRGESWLPGYG
jgi:hypothetical protein